MGGQRAVWCQGGGGAAPPQFAAATQGCAAPPAWARIREGELQQEVEAARGNAAEVQLQYEAAIRLGRPLSQPSGRL
jgi:hypothetical protein